MFPKKILGSLLHTPMASVNTDAAERAAYGGIKRMDLEDGQAAAVMRDEPARRVLRR